eukprot:747015-Pelagomonas_calceolata.AAC.2
MHGQNTFNAAGVHACHRRLEYCMQIVCRHARVPLGIPLLAVGWPRIECLSISFHAFPVAVLTGIAGHAHRNWGNDYIERAIVTRAVSLTMLGMAIVMAIWAGESSTEGFLGVCGDPMCILGTPIVTAACHGDEFVRCYAEDPEVALSKSEA